MTLDVRQRLEQAQASLMRTREARELAVAVGVDTVCYDEVIADGEALCAFLASVQSEDQP